MVFVRRVNADQKKVPNHITGHEYYDLMRNYEYSGNPPEVYYHPPHTFISADHTNLHKSIRNEHKYNKMIHASGIIKKLGSDLTNYTKTFL